MLPSVKKILFATDLRADSGYVFRYVLSQALQYDAKISIVHVVEPLSPFARSLVELHVSQDTSAEMHQEAREKVKAEIIQQVQEFCREELRQCAAGDDIVYDVRVIEDLPSQGILREAEQADADLIIMGTHQHTSIGEALLGSTALKVLHYSSKPVLLIRIPKDYRED